ncbi:WD repeat-containing protein, partial [Rhodopirellula maiorica SM1]
MGLLGAILATVMATVVTDTGTVEIRSDDPEVEIWISKGGETITVLDQQDKQIAILDTGTYELRTIKDGKDIEVDLPDSFTLRRAGREIFSIRRRIAVAPESAPEPALAERGMRQVHAIEWPDAHVYVTDFSPDGRLMLGAGDQGIRLWDVDSGELVHELQGHEGYVNAAAFSPDGKIVISGGWQDNMVVLWDVETGKPLRRLAGHEAGITRVDASSNGKQILSSSADRTLRIWDRQTGELRSTLDGHSRICGGRFSADGKQVLSFSHD